MYKFFRTLLIGIMFFAAVQNHVFAGSEIPYYQYKYYLSGKPAVVNVIILDEDNPYGVKVSFGDKKMHKLDTVENIARCAVAGVNAQYFKPDTGLPLGLSIVDGKLITGPILKRSAFGVTPDEEYKIAEVELTGNVCFSRDSLSLSNINQPILSKNGAYVYTNQWGEMTPETSSEYYHIVVKRGKVKEVSCQSTNIPKKAYAVVFNKNQMSREIELKEKAKYIYRLTPDDWNTMEYAVAAGPVLVRNGEKYIGEQSFQNDIIKGKAPRTAIGFTKENKLIILTVDGRQKGVSEGATLSELADLMLGFGAYQAMNLDGGSSTQMVVNGRVVNCPSTRRAAKVTNAILIYEK